MDLTILTQILLKMKLFHLFSINILMLKIKKFLSKKIEQYKIPSNFVFFLKKISLNKSEK